MSFAVTLASLLLVLSSAQTPNVKEKSLRQLFVVGDSISIQYGPYLEEYLEGVLAYDRKSDDGGAPAGTGVYEGPNGGDSRSVAGYLESRARDGSFKPDYLLVNCGLHDIRRKLGEDLAYQVSPEDYRENLERIYTVSREIGAHLIWVRTTPVVDSIHNQPDMEFHRYAADQEKYNAIADEVFKGRDVPILDLDGFTRKLGTGTFIDHVHFSKEVRALQGAFIAGFLSLHGQDHSTGGSVPKWQPGQIQTQSSKFETNLNLEYLRTETDSRWRALLRRNSASHADIPVARDTSCCQNGDSMIIGRVFNVPLRPIRFSLLHGHDLRDAHVIDGCVPSKDGGAHRADGTIVMAGDFQS